MIESAGTFLLSTPKSRWRLGVRPRSGIQRRSDGGRRHGRRRVGIGRQLEMASLHEDAVKWLRAAQNADGGWGLPGTTRRAADDRVGRAGAR